MVSASPVFDKTFTWLVLFIYEQYPESRLLSSPPVPRRCGFENLFAVADLQGTSRLKLRLYPRVSEIVAQTQERSAKLAGESKAVHKVLPLKHYMFAVADEPDYTMPLLVNLDFLHLAANKTIAKTRAGSISFANMEKLEKCSRSLLEGNSHLLWLMSTLLSQLKANCFLPSDPTLFDEAISSISCMLASQTSLAAAMLDFIVTKCKASLLSHVSLPLTASQKQELLVSPGSDSSLCN